MSQSLVPRMVASQSWAAIFATVALAGFGSVILYSAGKGSLMPWALPHFMRFAFLFVVAIALSYVKPQRFGDWAFPFYFAVLALLLLVEAIGAMGGGAQRWLDLGLIRLQPSEVMKLSIILVLARFYQLLPVSHLRRWAAVWPALMLIGVPAALIIIQPDLGTTLTVVGGGITVMFLAGLPLRYFLVAAAAAAALIPFVYTLFLEEYQQRRVTIFLTPEADPLGAGYHITQSKIAIGSGGLTGKGFLKGTQSHLNYLPEGHTDFVFATMAEEWGLLGGLFVLVCFGVLLRWAMGVSLRAKGRFERMTAAGLAMTIFFYVAINLMMVMGLAPVVGIPLPLVSYGGSAIMTVMVSIGILMSIDRASRNASHENALRIR